MSGKRLRNRICLLGSLLVMVLALAAFPRQAYAATASVSYRTHVQNDGWQASKSNGATAGTSGRGLRLEAIEMSVNGAGISGGITYRTHVQNVGWQGWVSDGALSGTSGKALRLEGIEIDLTGDLKQHYDVQYRVHVQNIGWQDWRQNGELAGTTGKALRLEAIEVRLVEKVETIAMPGTLNYIAHVQNIGWQDWRCDGEGVGTSGKALRVEALRLYVDNELAGVSGGITYRAHVQNIGWQDWKSNGELAGTMGQGLRLEAVEIALTGEMADAYDVYYRAHVQNGGWLGWAHNGQTAGSLGYGLRVEALEMRLVAKNDGIDGYTVGYLYVPETRIPIMGNSEATQADVIKHFQANATYPAEAYKDKGAPTIEDFVRILFEVSQSEGVRPDVTYAQAMLETNYLRFGHDVKIEQCNFAGIGATGGGNPGYTFPDVRTGLLAQVQHLKAYASSDPLNNECVDPRFNLVSRGIAPTLGGLSRHWATGADYGRNVNWILQHVDSMS